MPKHIILVHGRDIKPARSVMDKLARKAIENGLRRTGKSKLADGFKSGDIRFSLAYFGDISNDILAKNSKADREKLTETDPDFNNAKCFPAKPLEDAYELTNKIKSFGPAAYKKILSEAEDSRFLDEAADAVSVFGALLTAGLLNTHAINIATRDLGAYLTSHTVGSQVRSRLSDVLQNALLAKDDVCLLTHSMGCMVAYDVFWKWAHLSEYEDFRQKQLPVSLWLTFGNPLGETGVRRNLLDGRYPESDKYPVGQMKKWVNVYAQDDYIAHVEKVGPVFRSTKQRPTGLPDITDIHIENCWVYEDVKHKKQVSNPHDLYGYLMHQSLAASVAEWMDS